MTKEFLNDRSERLLPLLETTIKRQNIAGRVVVMFIHEMTEAECRELLQRSTVGRLACSRDDQPYIVPINFAFDGTYLYGFTTEGQKIEWMRSNPSVCFELDELSSNDEWKSVIVFGRYEELPDTPALKPARIKAHEWLQKRPVWWQPGYMAANHRDQPHSLTPIFYRIHINQITGHHATPERATEAVSHDQTSPAKRSLLDRLFQRPSEK